MSTSKKKISRILNKTAFKNMMRGAFFTAIYITTTIIIPFLTFTWIRYLTIRGIEIGITQKRYEQIVFWVAALGLVISGCAFFTYSSPKQSIRRGIFSLLQIILNCFYIWSYKFSGATEVDFVLIDYGYMSIDLTEMILIYLGVYFLTIILKIYDLGDFIINRDKIREERRKF
ncbi:MAG: hypothetical protein ACFFAN_02535 [Promethearchaeota archaeon]